MKLQIHHLVVGGWWCIATIDVGMWALSCMYTPRVTMFMFEHVIHMFEHVMRMFEHVMRMFEHVMRMFEHVMRTGAICARHGAASRPGRLQKSTSPVINGHLSPDFEGCKISMLSV